MNRRDNGRYGSFRICILHCVSSKLSPGIARNRSFDRSSIHSGWKTKKGDVNESYRNDRPVHFWCFIFVAGRPEEASFLQRNTGKNRLLSNQAAALQL